MRKEILQILFASRDKQRNCLIYYFFKLLWNKYQDWEKLISFYNKNEELKIHFNGIINLEEEKSLYCMNYFLGKRILNICIPF